MTGVSYATAGLAIIITAIFMKKFGNKKKNYSHYLLYALFSILIAVIIDIYFNINPLENLVVPFLAELAGIFVGIIIAFEIVEKNKDQIKKELWFNVRESAYESTRIDLIMLAIGVYSCLPRAYWTEVPGDLSMTKEKNKDIWEKLNKELTIFPDLAQRLIGFPEREVILMEGPGNSLIEVDGKQSNGGLMIREEDLIRIINQAHENIKPYLDEIKSVLINRTLQSYPDNDVQDLLIDFEKDINNYYYNAHRFSIAHFGGHSHGSFVIKSLVKLCESGSILYDKLEPN